MNRTHAQKPVAKRPKGKPITVTFTPADLATAGRLAARFGVSRQTLIEMSLRTAFHRLVTERRALPPAPGGAADGITVTGAAEPMRLNVERLYEEFSEVHVRTTDLQSLVRHTQHWLENVTVGAEPPSDLYEQLMDLCYVFSRASNELLEGGREELSTVADLIWKLRSTTRPVEAATPPRKMEHHTANV